LVSNNNINFEYAVELCKDKFSYEDLILLMQKDNLYEKQFAILSLEEIKNVIDGELLCSNLVGQDGKIREAVAFKLSELFEQEKYAKMLSSEKIFNIMLEGLMDINGNVCRSILDIDNAEFNKYLAGHLIKKIKMILEDISKLDTDDKKYVISKRNFQLYWALEGLYKVCKLMNFEDIKVILSITVGFDDYTIREKTAKILSCYNSDEVKDLKNILKYDTNYYVKRYICS
jgi:hypothetical protein